jgi:hypothetical protein
MSSTKVVRGFSRAARFGPIYSGEDLVFGWLDFPLPEFGLRYQELPKTWIAARTHDERAAGC